MKYHSISAKFLELKVITMQYKQHQSICFVIGISCYTIAAQSAIYYVDPLGGNDANAGDTKITAWKTIPGMRTADDAGFLRNTWGSISPGNPIQAGDIIELKAGTSITSAIGGRLQIDASYYQNGTALSPIVIRVGNDWGNGFFTYDASGMSVPKYYPAVYIDRRDYIQIRGADSTRRLSIKNTAGGGWGIMAAGSGNKQLGIVLDYLELANNLYGGSTISFSDEWIISNSISHDNGEIGFDTGGLSDSNANNGTYMNDEAYRNGVTVDVSGIAHGFGLYGSTNITFQSCSSHENGRDGFDFGTVTNTNSASATVIDSTSYNNGEDGFGNNGGTSGSQIFDFINDISFNNLNSGWHIYDGAKVGIYQSIAHSNGSSNNPWWAGNILTYAGEGFPPPIITLKNNIFYKPKAFQIGSYRSLGGIPVISSEHNLYVPRVSDSEPAFDFPYGTQPSYAEKPLFIGDTDRLGVTADPEFESAANTTNLASNDYHLSFSNSPAFKSGALLTSLALDANLMNAVGKDRDGKTRSIAPNIGPYEGYSSDLPAPSNLRILPE